MPECNKCGWYGPTAEFRRSTKAGQFLCKDKYPCGERTKAAKRAARRASDSEH